jgi:hypothetical protein
MSVTIIRKNSDYLDKLHSRLVEVCSKEVAVGYPREKAAAYPDGTPVAEVAAKNCFGIGVPQRNFMELGGIYIAGDHTIKESMELAAAEAANSEGSADVVTAMQNAAGLQAQALIQKAILEGDWEPNSQKTVKKKKSDQPLIDTSHMINSTTYVIRDKT